MFRGKVKYIIFTILCAIVGYCASIFGTRKFDNAKLSLSDRALQAIIDMAEEEKKQTKKER